MLKTLKQSWQRFQKGFPGRRFQQQFSQRQRSSRSPVQKALFISAGILLIAAGVFFLFVPGPGLLLVLLGAVLIAQRSLPAARTLDWTESHVRRLLIWSLRVWHRSSPILKILLVILVLIVLGAMGFGASKFLLASHGLGT